MPRGGKRAGAGRKAGSVTKKNQEIAAEVIKSGLTPLEYLMEVLRDEANEQSVRLDAANKAAPYVHARLSSIDLSSTDGTMAPPATVDPKELSDAALREFINASKKLKRNGPS